jgi:FkbM family methyltransferase
MFVKAGNTSTKLLISSKTAKVASVNSVRYNKNLIFDIGMSEGNDTDFYLKKGFTVVGVEADPVTYKSICSRFAAQIDAGDLIALNRAAGQRNNEPVSFYVNKRLQGHSKITTEAKEASDDGYHVEIQTIDWASLIELKGIPYFCKIDIEGAEKPFLSSIDTARGIPEYTSVEAHNIAPMQALYDLGYREFRLIDQKMHWRWPQPSPPLEGNYVPEHKFVHASGLFGKELPGDKWYSFEEIKDIFEKIVFLIKQKTLLNTWYDCHARHSN